MSHCASCVISVFDGCIHAREWITCATMIYVINELITLPEQYRNLLDRIDLYLMPVNSFAAIDHLQRCSIRMATITLGQMTVYGARPAAGHTPAIVGVSIRIATGAFSGWVIGYASSSSLSSSLLLQCLAPVRIPVTRHSVGNRRSRRRSRECLPFFWRRTTTLFGLTSVRLSAIRSSSVYCRCALVLPVLHVPLRLRASIFSRSGGDCKSTSGLDSLPVFFSTL
jgi:hypothetical protein